MLTFEKAIILAAQAHRGQTDYAGEPYILHPLRVAMEMNTQAGRVVAVLHDALEEDAKHPLTLDDLSMCEPREEIVDALGRLTKANGEDYRLYLRRCAESPLAFAVKLADIMDNSDPGRLKRLAEMPPGTHGGQLARRLADKYCQALKFLKPHIIASAEELAQHFDVRFFIDGE